MTVASPLSSPSKPPEETEDRDSVNSSFLDDTLLNHVPSHLSLFFNSYVNCRNVSWNPLTAHLTIRCSLKTAALIYRCVLDIGYFNFLKTGDNYLAKNFLSQISSVSLYFFSVFTSHHTRDKLGCILHSFKSTIQCVADFWDVHGREAIVYDCFF